MAFNEEQFQMQKLIAIIAEREKVDVENYAIAYTLIGTICQATAQAIFKRAHMSVFQSLADRAIISIILLYFKNPDQNYYESSSLEIILIFGFLMAFGSTFFFESLRLISLAEVTIIFQTNTIWAQFVGKFINNSEISKRILQNTIISFIGIILIARPNQGITQEAHLHLIGCLMILSAAMIQSVSFTVLKLIGGKVSSEVTTFYLHMFIIPMCGLIQLYEQDYRFSLLYFIEIFLISVITLTAHLLQFRAMQIVQYSKIANYTYFQVLITIGIDYVIFDITPPLLSILGGGLIMYSIFRQIRSQ